jgi:hypothetical protein
MISGLTEDYAALYGPMHEQKSFAGYSIEAHVPEIAALVERTGARRLLDYGSGGGYQYLGRRVHERWGGILPVCFDVGVWQLAERLEGRFEGVICTDVMEHIAEADVDPVLHDILGFTEDRAFVFFAVACRPAKKSLLDGRNCHLTVRPPEWWEQKLAAYRRDGLTIRAVYDTAMETI